MCNILYIIPIQQDAVTQLTNVEQICKYSNYIIDVLQKIWQ